MGGGGGDKVGVRGKVTSEPGELKSNIKVRGKVTSDLGCSLGEVDTKLNAFLMQ